MAPRFVQHSFATAPAVHLNGRSFTICCWIKQTRLFGIQQIYSDWWWTFELNIVGNRLEFVRLSHSINKDFLLVSTHLSLYTWTHVAVTWNHVTGNVYLYANGIIVGRGSFTPGTKFEKGTDHPYWIAGETIYEDFEVVQDLQFYGSVMDLYVFGTALSRDEIAKVRGR